MSEAFVVKENPNGKFILSLSEQFYQDFPDFVCHQSYSILAARLMNMTYPTFLRYCATHGGELVGKQGYPATYFKSESDAKEIAKEINKGYKALCAKLIP